jgi:Cu(I)/Ag(I) efflux system membrane fusion protein
MVSILVFVACGSNSDSRTKGRDVSTQFRSQLSDVLKIYFELKDALVAADSKLAIEKAAKLKTTLSNIDFSDLSGEFLTNWKQTLSDLQEKVAVQASKEDVETQRAAFQSLSETMIKCAKDFGPFDMPIYIKHCPMAFDNAGADWLSDKQEVFNPYFGEGMMYHCGTVKGTIAAK